jgi:hypothetical protein
MRTVAAHHLNMKDSTNENTRKCFEQQQQQHTMASPPDQVKPLEFNLPRFHSVDKTLPPTVEKAYTLLSPDHSTIITIRDEIMDQLFILHGAWKTMWSAYLGKTVHQDGRGGLFPLETDFPSSKYLYFNYIAKFRIETFCMSSSLDSSPPDIAQIFFQIFSYLYLFRLFCNS